MRLCYDASVRTTIDISDEAYYIAKAVAREQKRSLGRVVSDFIIAKKGGLEDAALDSTQPSGFPTFRCMRRVTSADVEALEDE